MAIVGEALVRVRIISDRMGAEIRDAVKKGLADADSDIDTAGQSTGKKLSNSVSKGVRANRDKMAQEIGKELVLSSRRFVADSEGAIDDAGNRLGTRLVTGIETGVGDRKHWQRIGHNLLSEFQDGSDSLGLDRSGRFIGDRFMQGISNGIREQESRLRTQIDGSVRRAITAGGSNSVIDKVGRDTGDRFTRAIGSGIGGGSGEDFFHNEFRRVFSMGDGSVIDGDSEVIGERIMGGVRNGVRRSIPDTARAFRDSATRARNVFQTQLGQHLQAFRGIGLSWGNEAGNGFGSGNAFRNAGRRAGEQAGEAANDGVRNGFNRNRGRLNADFGNIAKDLGKHFNLGFGAARMGPAIISILATAGPSLISGAAAIATSMAAEIITGLAAIGPGIAGGIGVGLAAISTLGLNLGLLKLAFSGSSDQAKAFKAEMTDFKTKLTQAFAPGVLSGFSDLIGKLSRDLLPAINDELAATGVAMGNVARGIADTVTSGDNLGRIKGILATNTTFLQNFGQGLNGLTTSFLILFNASKPFVDFIGEAVRKFGDWASASLAVSEANGSLAAWMDGMLASFKDLARIVTNFGVGFANIFKAASPAAGTMLDSIRDIGQRFRDWTTDSAGMARMEGFFTKAHILASKVWEVLGAIFTAGGRAFEGMDLGPILHVLDTLQNVVAPAIARFFNQIQAGASDNLVKAFDNIGTALTKMADSGNFEKVANLIGTVIEKITEFAATDFGSTILSFVVPFALMGGILTSLVGPLFAVGKGLFSVAAFAVGGEGALAGFAAAALPIVAIAAAVAGAFALIAVNSESFRSAIGDLVSAIGTTFVEIWDKVAPKIQSVWEKLQELAGVIGDRLAPIIEFLIPIIQRVFNFLGDSLGNFLDFVGGVIDILTGILSGDWGKIWQGVQEIFTAAWNQILNVFGFARDMMSSLWDAITAVVYNAGQVLYGFFSSIWTGITDIATSAWGGITSFLSDAWQNISDAAVSIWSGITNFFSGIWNNVTAAAESIWTGITSFFSETWNGISQDATSIWTGITDFFGGIWDGIQAGAETAWNGVTSFLTQVWDGIVEAARQVWNTLFEVSMTPLRLLVAFIQLIWDQIKDGIILFWDTATGILGGIWTGISDLAVTIWTGISDFFTTVWDGVSTAAATAWDAVTSFLGGVWQGISDVAVTIWTGITDFFSTVWQGVSDAAIAAWTFITDFLSTAWAGIVTVATDVWNGLVAIIQFVWDAITTAATAAWGVITEALTAAWNFIVAVATGIWNGVVAFFQFIWDTITSAVNAAWTAIQTFLSDTWTGISDVASAIWNGISSFFSAIWTTISTTFHSVVDAIVSWLSERWSEISSVASEIWNGIVGIASEIWNNIVQTIEGIVGPIVETLQGWWDDISEGVSSAWSGLEGIVSGIWEGIQRAIVAPIEEAFYALVGWVADIQGLIQGAWDTVSGIITNINDAIAGAADAVVGAAALPGASSNAPFAPATATGGVFRPTPGGQLRTIAEAGQAERVEPLDPNGLSVRDLAWIDQLMSAQGTGETVIHVYIGQTELTSLVDTRVEKTNNALARDARTRRP